MNATGSKPCPPGCTCGKHSRFGRKSIMEYRSRLRQGVDRVRAAEFTDPRSKEMARACVDLVDLVEALLKDTNA